MASSSIWICLIFWLVASSALVALCPGNQFSEHGKTLNYCARLVCTCITFAFVMQYGVENDQFPKLQSRLESEGQSLGKFMYAPVIPMLINHHA